MTVAPTTLATSPWLLLGLPAALYVVLSVSVARRRAWTTDVKLAVAGTGVVLVSVWMMSFASLMAFFAAAYIEVPLNALGPIAVDGEMAVGTIAWIAVGQGGSRLADIGSARDLFRWALSPRPYVALLVGGAAALSAVANAAHPYTQAHHWPAPWSYAASAVPGVVMFAVIHQLVILFRVLSPEQGPPPPPIGGPGAKALAEPEAKVQAPPAALEEPAEPKVEPASSGADEPEQSGRRKNRRTARVTLEEAKAEYRRLAARGTVRGSALGRGLGVSDVMGRIWLRRVRAKAEAEVEAKARRSPDLRFQHADGVTA